MTRWRIHPAGPPEVRHDGVLIPIAPAKQRVLVAALALAVEWLTAFLWADKAQLSARDTLQKYARRLRLGLTVDARPSPLVSSSAGHRVAVSTDVRRFRSLLRSARSTATAGQPGSTAAPLDEALPPWHGQPWTDVPADTERAAQWRVPDAYNTAYRAGYQRNRHIVAIGLRLPLPDVCLEPQPDEPAALAWLDAEHIVVLRARQLAVARVRGGPLWKLPCALTAFHVRRGHPHDQATGWRPALDATATCATNRHRQHRARDECPDTGSKNLVVRGDRRRADSAESARGATYRLFGGSGCRTPITRSSAGSSVNYWRIALRRSGLPAARKAILPSWNATAAARVPELRTAQRVRSAS